MDYEIKRADAADYEELIRFAEMVFSVDFSKVRPICITDIRTRRSTICW